MPLTRPVIAITAGDPCGIGPEVILKALLSRRIPARVYLVVIGDHRVFERTAKKFGRRLPAWRRVSVGQSWSALRDPLTFIDCAHSRAFVSGHASCEAGEASRAYLDLAVELWRAKRIHALVTAPVTKWTIAQVHPGFIGQTEYLARALGVREVAMMFVSDSLRVVLLTRHLPLRDVPHAVDRRVVQRTIQLTVDALKTHFHLRHPRLACCGLNPHAGEEGVLGREEQDLLLPVLRRLRRAGMACAGPFAADGLFAQWSSAMRRGVEGPQPYDAVICWYHDQGLIPFKMAALDRGCQMSIGLPIIRTSPDHGSALDIAGKGIANPGSMRYAIRLAATLLNTTRC